MDLAELGVRSSAAAVGRVGFAGRASRSGHGLEAVQPWLAGVDRDTWFGREGLARDSGARGSARTGVFTAFGHTADWNARWVWRSHSGGRDPAPAEAGSSQQSFSLGRTCGAWIGTIRRLDVQTRDAFRETGEEKEVKAECG